MQDFQTIFNEKTEELVRYLFENVAPKIKLEAAKIEKSLKPLNEQALPSPDLVDAFEGQDDEFEKPRGRFQKQGNNQQTQRGDSVKNDRFSYKKQRKPYDQNQLGQGGQR